MSHYELHSGKLWNLEPFIQFFYLPVRPPLVAIATVIDTIIFLVNLVGDKIRSLQRNHDPHISESGRIDSWCHLIQLDGGTKHTSRFIFELYLTIKNHCDASVRRRE